MIEGIDVSFFSPNDLVSSTNNFYWIIPIQAYLTDNAGSIPEHHNKANIATKGVTPIFWFPNAWKSYVYNYTVVY